MSIANVARAEPEPNDNYRYKRFTTRLLFRDLRFGKESASPGDAIPPFELLTTEGDRLLNGDIFGAKPVLFIFGSMTCPMTASAAPSVQNLYEEFGDQVDFIMLYVREAHPGELIQQAETMQEKLAHAQALQKLYDIDWPVAADGINGDLHRALDPKPNSAFLVSSEGIILFRSLWAADYDALQTALNATLTGETLERQQSDSFIGPVMKSVAHVQAVMTRGGPQAVRDLWRAFFPMALAAWVTVWFTNLGKSTNK